MKVTGQQYLDSNPDVKAVGVDPLQHVLTHVLSQPLSLREPRKLDYPDDFDGAAYVAFHKDVAQFYTAETALIHYLQYGWKEPGRWPVPAAPGTEVKSWQRMSECDNPVSPYFSVDWPYIGTYGYQGGDRSSEVYRYPHDRVMQFQAESVISMLDGICLLELGGPQAKGQIYYQDHWYTHSRWTLMLEIHKHSDGFYYATGMTYENPSETAGILRSSDKINWSVWYEDHNEYRFFELDSDPQGNLWIASTSSGMDWGGNNCNPSVFRNKDLVWRDTSRPNDGFWGLKCAFNDVFLGGSGHARVVRFSDKKTVLDLPGFLVIHSFVLHEGVLMALVCRDSDSYSSGARVYGTKDGDNWYQIGQDFDCPLLFQGKVTDGVLHIVGGRFSQNNITGFGRVYKGIR